ncbi:hypothetical protein [Dysgonomonas sp. 511]|uniref:hypothetical protein n=1 Tax=Dysgonomonas sp. 511 TaxID=2302930 RepID=UPI0013D38803|nr:hypothetical protein [Dysgonomonas sp. 511]
MKKLIFCCICILAMMACGERNSIMGRWAMEIEGTGETSFVMPDDTLCTPELFIGRDTLYMGVRADGAMFNKEFIGIYTLTNDEINVTDRMGNVRTWVVEMTDDLLIFTSKDESDIIIRLRRLKEEY